MGDPAFDSDDFDNDTFDRLISTECKFRGFSYDTRSDITHPLIERFARFLTSRPCTLVSPTSVLSLDGHAKLVVLLKNRLDNSTQTGRSWERTKAAIVAYAAAVAAAKDPRRSHVLLERALSYDNSSVSVRYRSLVQEGALLALNIWADYNGDTEAHALIKSPPQGFLTDIGIVAHLRRSILKGLPPMGDNAKDTGEARNEIDRLLTEKDATPDDGDMKLGPEGHRVTMNLPISQSVTAMRNMFGIHPRLGHAFLEALKVGDTLFMPANNLKQVRYYEQAHRAGLFVEGADFKFSLRPAKQTPEHVRIVGRLTKLPTFD